MRRRRELTVLELATAHMDLLQRAREQATLKFEERHPHTRTRSAVLWVKDHPVGEQLIASILIWASVDCYARYRVVVDPDADAVRSCILTNSCDPE